jgi:hypothetical protein
MGCDVKETLAYVQSLCKCERTGIRVVLRHNTIIVMDASVWPQSFTDGIHARFPSTTIDIAQSETSVANFQVLITVKKAEKRMRNFFILFCLFAGMIIFMLLNLHYTFHDHFITNNPWMPPNATNRSGIRSSGGIPDAVPVDVCKLVFPFFALEHDVC